MRGFVLLGDGRRCFASPIYGGKCFHNVRACGFIHSVISQCRSCGGGVGTWCFLWIGELVPAVTEASGNGTGGVKSVAKGKCISVDASHPGGTLRVPGTTSSF